MTMFETASANTYIDFFAGCGGLSLGLGWGGWRGVFAIEKDPMAFKTFEKNLIAEDAPHQHFEDWPAWLTKEPHTIEDVLENRDTVEQLKKMVGQVTLVAGGPPCQGFSVAGALCPDFHYSERRCTTVDLHASCSPSIK